MVARYQSKEQKALSRKMVAMRSGKISAHVGCSPDNRGLRPSFHLAKNKRQIYREISDILPYND